MTVHDLYEKFNKDVEHWSYFIYDMSGYIQLGYCNSVYPYDCVPDDIKRKEVESFTVGYGSLFVKVKLDFAEYCCDEDCTADGYTKLYPKEHGLRTLYRKTEADGSVWYAVVNELLRL